jgi:hypothetical protein
MYQFESSGNARVLIRALSEVNLLGVTYAANDIVAVFEQAYFTLGFFSNTKSITKSPSTILNYNQMSLQSINIEPKSLSYSHYNFIGTNKITDEIIYVPVKELITTDINGSVFFTRTPVNLKTVFIKNSNLVNVTGYIVDYTTGQVTGLTPNTSYTAFYYYQDVSLISYELNEASTPYFKIEITGMNNVNGTSRYMFLEIPRASIDIQPTLTFTQDNLATTGLKFTVIDGKAKVIYY